MKRSHPYPFGFRVKLARGVTSYGKRFRAGSWHSVALAEAMTVRDYDAHTEVPLGGWGVPHDAVLVPLDGKLVPYAEWARASGARCPRCREPIAIVDRCPEAVLRGSHRAREKLLADLPVLE